MKRHLVVNRKNKALVHKKNTGSKPGSVGTKTMPETTLNAKSPVLAK